MAKKWQIPKHLRKSVLADFFDHANQQGIAVDKTQWSTQSLHSYGRFDEFYQDRSYTCRYCRQKAIFTAAEQKHAYEVEKRYIWQNRVLCKPCFVSFHEQKTEIKRVETQWLENKSTLQVDATFLQYYLDLLVDTARYQRRKNTSMIVMLKKRLAQIQE